MHYLYGDFYNYVSSTCISTTIQKGLFFNPSGQMSTDTLCNRILTMPAFAIT